MSASTESGSYGRARASASVARRRGRRELRAARATARRASRRAASANSDRGGREERAPRRGALRRRGPRGERAGEEQQRAAGGDEVPVLVDDACARRTRRPRAPSASPAGSRRARHAPQSATRGGAEKEQEADDRRSRSRNWSGVLCGSSTTTRRLPQQQVRELERPGAGAADGMAREARATPPATTSSGCSSSRSPSRSSCSRPGRSTGFVNSRQIRPANAMLDGEPGERERERARSRRSARCAARCARRHLTARE